MGSSSRSSLIFRVVTSLSAFMLLVFRGAEASRVLGINDELALQAMGGAARTRRLADKVGENTILVVRVSAGGGAEQTKSTLEAITNAVFDRSPSVQSQIRECSNGALTMANGGAVEITLDYTIQGRTIDSDEVMKGDFKRLVEEQLNTVLPGEFDHVLYCLPLGTTNFGASDWVAFASYIGYDAYFNDGSCEDVLTLMHEMGHNMGLGHASQFSDGLNSDGEYGDKIGVMGIGDFQTRKCYNAAMSNLLGWYDDRYKTTLDGAPPENILKCLFGSAEYSLQPNADEYQLAYHIGNIIVSFNRKTGPNAQTSECQDQVAIHEFPVLSVEGLENSSNRLACLSEGQNYQGDGFVINVGEIDINQEPGCARVGVVVQPTQPPTVAPTIVLPPDATPSPTPSPTTTAFLIEYYIENFNNEDKITILVIGSCGEEIGSNEVDPGQGISGSFTTGLEDQYKFVITDEGGNGGATYSVTYRGVLDVPLTEMTQGEECHIIGDDSPRCDGSVCPGQTAAPSPSPAPVTTSPPVAVPTSVPDQPATSEPTSSTTDTTIEPTGAEGPTTPPIEQSTPSPTSLPNQPTAAPLAESTPAPTNVAGQPTASPGGGITPVPSVLPNEATISPGAESTPIPTTAGDQPTMSEPTQGSEDTLRPTPSMGEMTPEPTGLTGPTLPPATTTAPVASGGSCDVQVRIEVCPALMGSQQPVSGCDCYNFCDGVYLGCCAFGEFCDVFCPSDDFVGGCVLDDDAPQAPTPAPVRSPERPTFRPLPPSLDQPPSPSDQLLPPSVDDVVEGSCQRRDLISECAGLIASQQPIPTCGCYNYCDGEFIGCCEFDSPCTIAECPHGVLVLGCRLDGRENSGSLDVRIPDSPLFVETDIWDILGDRAGSRRRLRDLFPLKNSWRTGTPYTFTLRQEEDSEANRR